ncbi:MAG: hypothetical protein JRJ27_13800 [Deltaproteobacteria bacterium]|nr:hypothetical protein [Deltaproteobacteria bacterium]
MKKYLYMIIIVLSVLMVVPFEAVSDNRTQDGLDFTVLGVYPKDKDEIYVRVSNISEKNDKTGEVLVKVNVAGAGMHQAEKKVLIKHRSDENVYFNLPDYVFFTCGVKADVLTVTVEIWDSTQQKWRFYDPKDFLVSVSY